MVDKANGDATEAGADRVERITGVEISYIDCCIEQNRKFENGNWVVMAAH
jgi:hypothetical protein